MNDLPIFRIKDNEIAEIESLFNFEQIQFDYTSCDIDKSLLSNLRRAFTKTSFYSRLQQKLKRSLFSLNKGFLIVDFGQSSFKGHSYKNNLTFFLSGIIHPFGIFHRFGIWKEITVDLNKESKRSSGIGYNPFHIDFVNTSNPPLFSILFCVREDPNKGGRTIISNFHQAINTLSEDEINLLHKPIFTEGNFYDLKNVGEEFNPFPILELTQSGKQVLRFTSKIDIKNNFDFLIRKIEGELIKNQVSFLLKSNQLLLLNQQVVCHGRLALNGDQSEIESNKRRLLLQTFGRSYDTPNV